MNQLKIIIGTLFGAGLLPKAPGTWGSLFTLPIIYVCYLVAPVNGVVALALAASGLSLWSTDANVARYGDDPPQFVIDETAGQALVFILTPFHYSLTGNLALLVAGFILFRIFDIFKPLGVNALQKLPGKFGILLDDLAAGVYALACLELLKILTGSLL
jgi:phosphatidylglycerophosphatase A